MKNLNRWTQTQNRKEINKFYQKPKILQPNIKSSIWQNHNATLELKNLNQKPQEVRNGNSKLEILKPNIERSIWQTQINQLNWKTQTRKRKELYFKTKNSQTKHEKLNLTNSKRNIWIEKTNTKTALINPKP